jgi:hypothetical protein
LYEKAKPIFDRSDVPRHSHRAGKGFRAGDVK